MVTKTSQISNISRFRVQYPIEPDLGSFETISGPDMCEPDNSLSIPEIIARYTRGQGLGVEAKPWQVGSADEDGYNPMDVEGFDSDLIPPDEPAPADPAPVDLAPVDPAPAEPEKS